MKPILKYPGGKSKEIPQFLQYVPDDFDTYIEPFLGGGSVYFHLEPDKAIVNDASKPLMTFYGQVRDEYPVMKEELSRIRQEYDANRAAFEKAGRTGPDANEKLYYEMRERFNHPDGSLLEGTVYYFINKTTYSGMMRYNRKGEFNCPFGKYAHIPDAITEDHSRLLQRAELYNTDCKEIFGMARENDFMFLDPPYDGAVFTGYNKNPFGRKEHLELAEAFKKLPCKALMIIGKTPLTEELYKDYIAGEYHKHYSVNVKARINSNAIHLIVKNY